MDYKMEVLNSWSTLKVYNQTKTAEIDIEGVIGFEPWWSDEKKTTTKELMKSELKKIANLDVDEITVRINSYGGDVNHGVSMHDLLAESKAKVITEVRGHSASAATIIAQAGDERRISANALYLVHQAQTAAMGTAEDMEATKKMLDTVNKQMAELYSKRSGKSVEEVRAVMDRNNGQGEWITPDEAKALGFIDTIVEPFEAAASAMPKPEQLAVWNIPEIPQIQNKEPFKMFDWLKEVLNLTPEQGEILDKMPESVENVKAEMQANIDALNAEKAELETAKNELEGKLAEAEAKMVADAEKFESANTLASELSEVVAVLESEKAELSEKLEKVNAGIKPPVQEDANVDGDIVAVIKARAEQDGSDYQTASRAVFSENPELMNKYVISKRK